MIEDFKGGEIRGLKLIGIFQGRTESPLYSYNSNNVIFWASPLMLQQDYETQSIRGRSFKKSGSFFESKEEIEEGFPIYARWQRFGDNQEVIEIQEDVSSADYETLNSLRKGDVFTFEANLSFLYGKVDNWFITKSPLLFDVRNIHKYKERGANKKMRQLIKKEAF